LNPENAYFRIEIITQRGALKYKDRELIPVRLYRFVDDYGTAWTALRTDGKGSGHVLSGHSTKTEVIGFVDESAHWRFDDLSILAYRFTNKFRLTHFGRLDKDLDYAEAIAFAGDELEGWIRKVPETDRLVIILAPANLWVNHPRRDNLRRFWQDCPITALMPETEAEYLDLVAEIENKL
jgi:hypothetical protein